VVARIADMPRGSLGFRATGTITRDEYHDALLAPIDAALERGERINLLIELGPDFGLDLGALWEDLKAGGSVGLEHRSSWSRMAIVTDKDWIRHGVSGLGWLSPGELRVFEPGAVAEARAWVGEAA
jgi:hypothetical protein